jgi:hypothetical protein
MFATMQTAEPRINSCVDSPTRGLFLTCTEGILLFYIRYMHNTYNIQGMNEFAM